MRDDEIAVFDSVIFQFVAANAEDDLAFFDQRARDEHRFDFLFVDRFALTQFAACADFEKIGTFVENVG